MATYLNLYEQLSSGNEAPRVFHVWAGISTLSSVIGRQVWVNRGNVPPVYPNLYIILTSPPGTKKTTALQIAKRFVRDLGDIPIAPSTITKEQIIVTMDTTKDDAPCKKVFKWNGKTVTYSHFCVYANEFINQINAGMNPIGMVDFLVDAWDTDEIKDETKGRGKFLVTNPFITMLAAMTDYTAKTLNTQKVISAGMLRRCVFVLGEDSGIDIPRPELDWSQEQKDAKILLTSRAKDLRFVQGQFEWTNDAALLWDTMYRVIAARRRAETAPIQKEFYQTMPELILKIAMLLQLSENPEDLKLTAANLASAKILIEGIHNGASLLFEGSGRNELNIIGEEIVRVCTLEHKPLMDKYLFKLHKNNVSWEEFKEVVQNEIRVGRLLMLDIIDAQKNKITYISTPEKIKALATTAGKP